MKIYRLSKGYRKESAKDPLGIQGGIVMNRREPIIEEWKVEGKLFPGLENE